jgi:hypothetical protein
LAKSSGCDNTVKRWCCFPGGPRVDDRWMASIIVAISVRKRHTKPGDLFLVGWETVHTRVAVQLTAKFVGKRLGDNRVRHRVNRWGRRRQRNLVVAPSIDAGTCGRPALRARERRARLRGLVLVPLRLRLCLVFVRSPIHPASRQSQSDPPTTRCSQYVLGSSEMSRHSTTVTAQSQVKSEALYMYLA